MEKIFGLVNVVGKVSVGENIHENIITELLNCDVNDNRDIISINVMETLIE